MDLGRDALPRAPALRAAARWRAAAWSRSRARWDPAARPRRQAPYAGSLRARRGALLRAALAGERPRASATPRRRASLVADGLLALRDGVLVAPAAIVAGDR